MSGMNLAELRDAAEYRDVWSKLTMAIAGTHPVDSTRWWYLGEGERNGGYHDQLVSM